MEVYVAQILLRSMSMIGFHLLEFRESFRGHRYSITQLQGHSLNNEIDFYYDDFLR